MPDGTLQILGLGTSAAPLEYQFSGSQSFDLIAVKADFNGGAAAVDWVPVVEIVSDAGHVMAQAEGDTVPAGESRTVTFAPFLGRGTATPTPGTGIQFNTTPQSGGWLEVIATGQGGSENVGILLDSTKVGAFTGIEITSLDGDLLLDTHGDGNIQVNTAVGKPSAITVTSDADGGLNLTNTGPGGLNLTDSGGGGMFFHTFDGFTHRLTGGDFVITGLPTVNPGGSGIVWNNGGVLSIT
jgi:hypothetical protein